MRSAVAMLAVFALLACAAGLAHAQQPSPGSWNFEDVDDAAPSMLQLLRAQALDIGLFAAFATLALVSFFRKSVALKYVTLVAAVLYMGVYKSQLVSVVNVFGVTGGLIRAAARHF
ncbi:MAG TPA: hypothetical protein VFV10_14510, partial [Gammaproteobacteria bacterium]|nr:hypothetical protein [Gammaproteobacteria bacterium]